VGAKSLCCGKADRGVQAKFRASLGDIAYPKTEVIKDPAKVLARLEYWKDSTKMVTKEAFYKTFPQQQDKYLTIEMDTGGFNNIRLGLESMVVYAALTGRIMVFPPATSWYLINNGQISAWGNKVTKKASNFIDFFDLKDMCNLIRCMSAEEFVAKEKGNGFDVHPKQYQLYIREMREKATWGWTAPIDNVVYVPSKKAFDDTGELARLGDKFIGQRKGIDLNEAKWKDPKVLHFPSGNSLNGGKNYRFLGQIAALAAFANPETRTVLMQMVRDRIHYLPKTFEVAAKVVAHLGMFGYSSLHIRRNELQYKDVFISMEKLRENVEGLFMPGEIIYVATDQSAPHFLDALRKTHTVYIWKDFFEAKGGNVLTDVDIPSGIIGQIEQVICAGGRSFAGTDFSTFSGFIPRLRAYMDAPDKGVYVNTRKLFKPWDTKPALDGYDYFHENPMTWKWLDPAHA
jgi:hypothetical protein